MLLIQDGILIAYAKRDQNFFVFDLATLGKIIQVNEIANATTTTGQERPTHLVNHSKKVRVWHGRLGYASNAKIICASK